MLFNVFQINSMLNDVMLSSKFSSFSLYSDVPVNVVR